MSSTMSSKLVLGSILIGACAIICLAITVQAQYNTFDSDSNSDSDGNPILTQAELGKLVRNSAKAQARQSHHQSQQAASTRNLYNRQQPLQYSPTQQNKRNSYGGNSELSGYGPVMGAASHGRGSNANANNDNDDDNEGPNSNFGSNFNSNFDSNINDGDNDGERSGANNGEGAAMNLNQAASGYPGQGDYSNEAAGAGFGFGGSSGYGPSSGDGSEFGPSEGFGGEGRRAKSASSPLGQRNYGSEDDAGAPQFGPNSAVNSGDRDGDDERANFAPEGQNDNENDDE